MRVNFGNLNAYGVEAGVRNGMVKYHNELNDGKNGLPVSLRNSQFTQLEDKLERIATAVESMAERRM